MSDLERVLEILQRHEKKFRRKLEEEKGNSDIIRGALHSISIMILEVEEMLLDE